MNFFITIAIFYHFISTSHIENFQNFAKSYFENLPNDPIHKIIDQLDQKDRERLSKTSKEFFQYDPREVVLHLPLAKNREPTPFVCQHLKIRKKLKIIYGEREIYAPSSNEKKFFECFSGIEHLSFDGLNAEYNVLSNGDIKILKYFPKLQHLEFRIGTETHLEEHSKSRKSLNLDYQFDSKLIISQLNDLPKFKRLSIVYHAGMDALIDILINTNDVNYKVDLEANLGQNNEEFYEYLPTTIENLYLKSFYFKNKEKFCKHLSTLKQLKRLFVDSRYSLQKFDCLLRFLPPSLIEFKYDDDLGTSDLDNIVLPKSLNSVTVRSTTSNVFELLANYVHNLDVRIYDPIQFLKIKNSFTRVKNLKFNILFVSNNCEIMIHLLDLLPVDMDYVELNITMKEESDAKILEEKIYSMDKRIKHLVVSGQIWKGPLTREYVFDGTKMMRKQ